MTDRTEVDCLVTWPKAAADYHGALLRLTTMRAAKKWYLIFGYVELFEAAPADAIPAREQLERTAGEGRYSFWIDDGRPVSMAGIVRSLRTCAAIAGVYTPPALRGRGYAGSVTAAVLERIYAEGRTTACLYTDLSNPFSNRCYAKIGFKPVCSSFHFHRRTQAG